MNDAFDPAVPSLQSKPINPWHQPRSPTTVARLIGGGAAIGLLADLFLRASLPGLGWMLFVASLCGAVVWLWTSENLLRLRCPELLGVIGVLGVMPFWRDAPLLTLLNIATVLGLLVLVAANPARRQLYYADGGRLLSNFFNAIFSAVNGFFGFVGNDAHWLRLNDARTLRMVRRVFVSLLLTIPLVGVFFVLLRASDAGFSQLTAPLFDWDARAIMTHVLRFSVFAVFGLLLLRSQVFGPDWDARPVERPAKLSAGTIEVSIVLGSIGALFTTFVLVQYRYLFGGSAFIQETLGLTYTEYCRDGFFELLAISGLLFVIMLMARWLTSVANPRASTVLGALSGLLIGLLYAMMASSFWRLYIYIDAFGLTEMRLYVAVFLGWMAFAFGWLGYRLMARRELPFFGVLLHSLLAALFALNAINPHATVVRFNLERAIDPAKASTQFNRGKLDRAYLGSLGAEAVPVLVEALPRLNETQRADALAILHRYHQRLGSESIDWRSWNLSRAQARAALEPILGELPPRELSRSCKSY